MAYRDNHVDRLEAPTAEGVLAVELGPRDVRLTVSGRTLHIVGRTATVHDHAKQGRRQAIEVPGALVTARDVPHDDLGIWIAQPQGMRRIFGVAPVNLLRDDGLSSLAAFDRVAQRVRGSLLELAGDVRKALEIGGPLGKLLFAEYSDRHVVYARRLFRDGARPALEIFGDGRIVVHEGKKPRREVVIHSRFGVMVSGDFVRFAAPDGKDLARVSIPWLSPEDRLELARRIGQLVDASSSA